MNSLGRTPKITRSALLPFVCQNHVATGVLLVLGTNTTSKLNSYAPTTAETTREPSVQMGAVRPGMGGRLDRLHHATKKFSETPLPSTKTHHGFTNRDLWSRRASYQKILAKTKTSPRGLGAVRPATRDGLTSCTQQRTPSKNT
jgi:hypothetical protein